ncbi:hypothetical protein F5144DRAFT_294483 [Chaetomium tenue]|uniref:Uncharacterized protein n=1 Tax=Chaetomium tenue TaxID=1854479 RepID=A0ACB7P227_9PEZI|nr:hypothetical protein F5144DRAFT_294483 [Chaetomium globosum]
MGCGRSSTRQGAWHALTTVITVVKHKSAALEHGLPHQLDTSRSAVIIRTDETGCTVGTPCRTTLRRPTTFLLPGFLLGPGCVGEKKKKKKRESIRTHRLASKLTAEKVLFLAPHPIHPTIQDQGQCGMPWLGIDHGLFGTLLVLGRNDVPVAPPHHDYICSSQILRVSRFLLFYDKPSQGVCYICSNNRPLLSEPTPLVFSVDVSYPFGPCFLYRDFVLPWSPSTDTSLTFPKMTVADGPCSSA